MAADKTDTDGTEDTGDTGGNKPENETVDQEAGSSAAGARTGDDRQPEEVETEIVDEHSGETGTETYTGSETTNEEKDASAGGEADKPSRPGGVMSPGLILAGVLLLVAAFTLFSYLSRDDGDGEPQVAQNEASPLAAALDGAPEPSDPQDVPAEETPAVPSTTRDETQVAQVPAQTSAETSRDKTGNQSDEMKQAARTGQEETDGEQAPARTARDSAQQEAEAEGVPLTAAQLAQQRREAAADRARQRQGREETETAAPSDDATAQQTAQADTSQTETSRADTPEDAAARTGAAGAGDQADQSEQTAESRTAEGEGVDEERQAAPVREARADTATGAVTAEARTDTALQETRAALAEQRQTNAQQAREIEALRRQIDTALAEQDRRSQQRIAQLERRIEQIQTQDVAAATKQAAIALAVSNLQRQMYSGRPYGDQLSVLERLTGKSQPVRQLRDHAAEGLPPMSYLQYSFLDAARSALAAARRQEASGPFGEFWANFVGLFSVRKTGAQSGDSPSAIISRAEASLENGDLEAALRELAALEGEPAEAMAPWIEEARARVEADQTLDALTNNVLSQAG